MIENISASFIVLMETIEQKIRTIAANLWTEWNPEVRRFFFQISPYIEKLFNRNIHRFLSVHNHHTLPFHYQFEKLKENPEFLAQGEHLWQLYTQDLERAKDFFNRTYPDLKNKTIAYFSMEYGFDTLPIYSGGLGILSGDHLRGASDLGLPMVGVGLLYRDAYFEQQVDLEGCMRIAYAPIVPPDEEPERWLPLEPVKHKDSGEDLMVEIPIQARKVKARVWRAKIGGVDLLLLDTWLKDNKIHDRHITQRLYASRKRKEEERRRRVEQEMVLGIGGAMALWEAGYKPDIFHLNEGHVAFACFEVMRHLMAAGRSFEEAKNYCLKKVGFTTHTPVPEGNERFDERLVRDHLGHYLSSFLQQHDMEYIYNCARNKDNMFDMTKLSLMLAGTYRNGVSALHGEVCRRMWGFVWGIDDPSGKDVPIGSITNSVHVPYWQKPELAALIRSQGGLEKVHAIPDETIWKLHVTFKEALYQKLKERLGCQWLREGLGGDEFSARMNSLLGPEAFYIGFARRFAQYKRVTLVLDDEERLFHFLKETYRRYQRPVQMIFAGKPHPDNLPARNRIHQIFEVSRRLEKLCEKENFKAQVFFVEGYDIELARYLEAGSDIWLNNPIRPLEASGTSGMKAGINGVLNVSINDGWVPEGIRHGENGWIFGAAEYHSNNEDRDLLYQVLENEVVPAYFDRPPGCDYSPRWIKMMKESIHSLTNYFNTDRMLMEYTEKVYLPAALSSHVMA